MELDNLSKPKITVIIPSYNRAHCIENSLDSVYKQSYKNYEIIVIDDGSTDKTEEVLKKHKDRIRYIKQENKGLSETRNIGLKLASHDLIAFLDSDDVWLVDNLENHVNAILENKDIILNTTNSIIFREHIGSETDLFEYNGCRKEYKQDQLLIQRPLIPYLKYGLLWMQSALVKKDAFIKAGPWKKNHKVWMDFDMAIRLASLGSWGVTMTPKLKILRSENEEVESISSKSNQISGIRELFNIYNSSLLFKSFNEAELDCLRKRAGNTSIRLGLRLIAENKTDDGLRALKEGNKASPSLKNKLKSIFAQIPSTKLRKKLANSAG